jgi:hypothetical protein
MLRERLKRSKEARRYKEKKREKDKDTLRWR